MEQQDRLCENRSVKVIIMSVIAEASGSLKSPFFDVIGNFVSITSKTLCEDRTAADKKHVAYCDPPQAENLVNEILFYVSRKIARQITAQMKGSKYGREWNPD